ncbi:MAG: amidohydrolase family protein [Thermaerobacter sp.]|nr:amidohydrolase family protein [Thermaerobacter sp.]
MERAIVYAGAQVAGARAVAVQGGRIAALGDLTALRRQFPDCAVRSVSGSFLPAALDGHLHLVEYGLSLGEVDLRGADAVHALRLLEKARAVLPADAFLLGRGARPAVLEALAAGGATGSFGPLRLWAQDFHTALTDPTTLHRLGLDRTTPPGGEVVRDEKGRPTGLLREAAAVPLAQAAAPDQGGRDRAARLAIEALYRQGIVGAVSFEDASGEASVAKATQDLPFRAYVYRYADGLTEDERPQALSRRAVRIGAKYFMDGTLGSRTAWLMDPYADAPGTGMPRLEPRAVQEEMRILAERGFSLALHAIGDRAANEALSLLRTCPTGDAPHRIEHLQIVADGFAGQLAQAGITASLQPCHLEQDLQEARSAWADRLAQTYPYHALLAAGATVAFGSDAPVEVPSPQLGLRWATGADAVGGGVVHAIGLKDAWDAYTGGVYRSVGRRGGRIAVGEMANLALYARGPLEDEAPTLVLSEGIVVHHTEGAYQEEAQEA